MMVIFLANDSSNSTTNNSCPSSGCDALLHPVAFNLTASYANHRNEATMVFTSVVMFMLAALFFNHNLFSRFFSDVSAILNPTVRLFLPSSLSLFLPVMSYLFSEAKNEGSAAAAMAATSSSSYRQQLGGSGTTTTTELSLRARTILMWMLLVELLRKKLEAILVNVGVQSYSSTIDWASRIAWLGYLVFYNLSITGNKAIYGTLWVFAAAKLLQRLAINELLKRSLAYGKNAEQMSWYMAKIDEKPYQLLGNEGTQLMEKCKYAVMGEDDLELKVTSKEGYQLEMKENAVVTVGDIWKVDMKHLLRHDGDPSSLKRVCLSFTLYKLLHRRLEDHPITKDEARCCQFYIFRGLRLELQHSTENSLGNQKELKDTMVADALFQVFYEEVQFLCEYYHSVLPVVLSNPFFFVANYVMFPVVVWVFCLLTFILCGNGDVVFSYQSITTDGVLFTAIDLAVTILLLLTFLYEQVWELLVFIHSNWLMVSLLCEYTAKRQWRQSRIRSGLICSILWVRRKMSRPNLCFKQLSVLGFGGRRCLPFMSMTIPRKKAVPMEVKRSIMDYLVAYVDADEYIEPWRSAYLIELARMRDDPSSATDSNIGPLSNGWSTIKQSHYGSHQLLLEACESKSVAEVILTWHIATSLMEVKYPPSLDENKTTTVRGHRHHRDVATSLSGYAAYLVASCPELLPDSTEVTKRVYDDMKSELREVLGGSWSYHVSLQRTRFDKLVHIGDESSPEAETKAARKGAELGKKLMEMAEEGQQVGQVWELLAKLWAELMVFLAPSSGEHHVKAHKEALAMGGEFITVLWAMCTHTGITRPFVTPWEAAAAEAAMTSGRSHDGDTETGTESHSEN
ncbi:hypothetical protein HU200_019905 [Digitaria exilis]|uniref:DUF4220 domain-containing protein n=1 Tax=Digitaria exilis TaxID=1010633 RepID=A0A835KCN1_9POAL|nr:hypothetical protein HU200_019905 [Digitaria exilis]